MHRANPFAGKCIHCAFRSQQTLLRARRLNIPYALPPRWQSSLRIVRRVPGPHHGQQKVVGVKRPDRGAARRIGRADVEFGWRDSRLDFDAVLEHRLNAARSDLKDAPLLEQLRKEAEESGKPVQTFDDIWKKFCASVQPNPQSGFGMTPLGQKFELTWDLKQAFQKRGQHGLDDRIRYLFYAHLTGSRFGRADIRNQREVADLRYPTEWYPATRVQNRTVHLHVGPTNSGKTYHALQRLEQAQKGVYAGPLRLLAHEVYTRMNAKGKPCALVTGEERSMASSTHGEGVQNEIVACTVEMIPSNVQLDVAVIDEIQMIGSPERGWAWTQALLAVQAKEVHLCGEERTVPLIQEICASLGEKLVIHHYERLSPLKMAETSLKGKLENLQKGDCIVCFSVMGIHSLRRQIERATGRKVATVYGSLPPETRAQQARLFNDPDNEYDYLVASDAVGMGLNLAIKRVVFEATSKYDGMGMKQLRVADLKQIAGRAGRYRVATQQNEEVKATEEEKKTVESLAAAKGEPSPPATEISHETVSTPTHPIASIPALPSRAIPSTSEASTGLVTTLQDFDFPIVQQAMTGQSDPIQTAGLFPPSTVLERFGAYFPPSTPFSYILTRLQELSQVHSRFHLCNLHDFVWIADLIEPVRGLTVTDRNIMCACPASKSDRELWARLMPAYARVIAEQSGGDLLSIKEIPLDILDMEVSVNRDYLRKLEQLHKSIVAYLWLSYRFRGIFVTRAMAMHAKELVEAKIEEVLGSFHFSENKYRKMVEQRERKALEAVMGGLDAKEGEADENEVGPRPEVDFELGQERDVIEEEEGGGKGAVFDRFGGEEDLPFEDPVHAQVLFGEGGEEMKEENVTEDAQVLMDELQDGARELRDANIETNGPTTELASEELQVSPPEHPTEESLESRLADHEIFAIPEPADTTHEMATDAAPSADQVDVAAEHTTPLYSQPRPQQPKQPHLSPSIPPKHLHTHLDADVKEIGTDAASRP